jgi:hypothetical protein
MSREGLLPHGENLRRAVDWIGHQPPPVTAAMIEEASRRYDLSAKDEEFLLREFLPRRDDAGSRS